MKNIKKSKKGKQPDIDLDDEYDVEAAELFFEHGVDLASNTLYIGSRTEWDDTSEGGVDSWLTENVLKGLHLLSHNELPVTIIINNPGGEVVEGMAIYDTIKAMKNHVTIIGKGKIFSMAGYIMQAGDVRLMQKHSLFMLHEGSFVLSPDHPKIVESWMKIEKHWDKVLFDMYYKALTAKNPKFTKKKLHDMLRFDTILTADQAVEYGFVDGIA